MTIANPGTSKEASTRTTESVSSSSPPHHAKAVPDKDPDRINPPTDPITDIASASRASAAAQAAEEEQAKLKKP